MNDGTLHDGKLHELARRLGAQSADRLDVEAAAQAVVQRLRERPAVVTPLWARPAWLRIAAALVVLVGGAIVTRGVLHQPAAGLYVAEDLTGLSADELRQLLSTLDETLTAPSTGSDTGLEVLNEQQLQEVLRSLEG